MTMTSSKPEKRPEMMRRITSYQALWKPQENKGHFWFTYFDGDRERTRDLDAESFRTMMKLLDTDKPIFGDHITCAVAVHSQPTDIKVGAWA
jgi:predicted ATPase